MNQSDTKMTLHNLLAIFCKHFTAALEGLARSSIFRPKMHQMSFGGRAPPGPAGGAYSAPQTPSCIETLRVFGARSRLTPSALGNRAFRFFFSHSNTERGPRLTLVWGPRMVNTALLNRRLTSVRNSREPGAIAIEFRARLVQKENSGETGILGFLARDGKFYYYFYAHWYRYFIPRGLEISKV